MTIGERSRKEIRDIAAARLSVEKRKLEEKRREANAENITPKIPPKLRSAMATYNQLALDLKEAGKAVLDQAALAGLEFSTTYEGYRESALHESHCSPRRKAINEEYQRNITKLDEAFVILNETLALAFSPAEFKTAFDNFCKAINK